MTGPFRKIYATPIEGLVHRHVGGRERALPPPFGRMTAAAKKRGRRPDRRHPRSEIHVTDIPIKNFKPIGEVRAA